MPKLLISVPKYRRRADRDLAFVVVAGKRIYVGPYNSTESRIDCKRLILEWPNGWKHNRHSFAWRRS